MSEYIERGALEAKAVYMHGFGENKYVSLKAIQQATAADVVEVKHAKWIGVYDGWGSCSNCKSMDKVHPLATNCRFCGAKMDGGADNG